MLRVNLIRRRLGLAAEQRTWWMVAGVISGLSIVRNRHVKHPRIVNCRMAGNTSVHYIESGYYILFNFNFKIRSYFTSEFIGRVRVKNISIT